jgi:hypothetical protein
MSPSGRATKSGGTFSIDDFDGLDSGTATPLMSFATPIVSTTAVASLLAQIPMMYLERLLEAANDLLANKLMLNVICVRLELDLLVIVVALRPNYDQTLF